MKKLKKYWDNELYNSVQLSNNFNMREFLSSDTGSVLLYAPLITRLQKLRDCLNKPIKILSGYRTRTYNKKIGGSSNSEHVKGRAADIRVKGVPLKKVTQLADSLGFTGIIAYPKRHFVHLDMRSGRYVVVPKGWL